MKLHTLAGDVIDLRFLWPPGTMHKGRQAARRYAERMEQVITMRKDPSKADGWETLYSVSTDLKTNRRTVNYVIIPGLTPAEREIPMDELWVRDKQAPMVNVEDDSLTEPFMYCSGLEPPTEDAQERGRAIFARFLAHILSALSNNPKAP